MPETDAPPQGWLTRRQRRALAAGFVALLLALVSYSVTTVPGARAHQGFSTLVDGWLQNGILFGATLLIACRAALVRSGRWAWASISLGVGLYALGSTLYYTVVQYQTSQPYPSVADAAWLTSYVFLYAGLFGLARPRIQISQRTLWLDAAVGALGVTSVAAIYFAFVMAHTAGSTAAVFTTMAYPVCDLVLLVVAIGTSGLLGWRPDRIWIYLGVGFVLFTGADTLYVIRVANETYVAGTLMDPLWAIAAVLWAAAALRAPRPAPAVRDYGWSMLVVPTAFVLLSLGLLVVGTAHHVPVASVVLATLTVVAGLVRAGITFHDVQALAINREQARTDDLLEVAAVAEAAHRLAERLRASLQSAFMVGTDTVYIDVSIGIAVCPDVASDLGGLLQRADIAMYQAKAERRGALVYEADEGDLTAHLRFVEELHGAVAGDELVLHYQLKKDLQTGAIDSVEALVRWQHPARGLLMPDTFIPSAERYGFMRLLTGRVLALALDQVAAWRATGGPPNVAVNVSASNLLDTDLPEQIATMLEVRGLPGEALTVEITEGVLMVDTDRASVVLQSLRDHGVQISIDDYGTGYSSLARLRDLPVTELKLDRSFVQQIEHDERAAAIVRSTVQLAHSLGVRLVAEGVESGAVQRLLTDFGCDVGQGYHFGRPQPAAELMGAPVVPAPRAPSSAKTAAGAEAQTL